MIKMKNKIGNKEKIYQLLQKEPSTSIDLAEKLTINEDPIKNVQFIRAYILRLKKEDKLIESIEKKGRYNVYRIIQKEANDSKFPDTQILKKMIRPFVEKNIELDLENNEIERIKTLWEEINNNA